MLKRNLDIDRRSRSLAQGKRGRGPVIYWMSRDQRADDNWALLWAQQEAIIREKELFVLFIMDVEHPGNNSRHLQFMLKGLLELQGKLARFNITLRLLMGSPAQILPGFLYQCDADTLVTDFDPLRYKRDCVEQLRGKVSVPFVEVDAHNIIPAWIISSKREYAAYTIRPKVERLLGEYLTLFPPLQFHPAGQNETGIPLDIRRLAATAENRYVAELDWLQPGEIAAADEMQEAVVQRLKKYSTDRNNPCLQAQSGLSPYLHFGQLSAQRLALSVSHSDLPVDSRKDFLEELVVRRELAENFCFFEPDYDKFRGFPEWARKTLDEHRRDKRNYRYSMEQFEQADTHEPLWNACQQDLIGGGKLHGYLRMYWAKKILEWTREPEEALEYAILLNDRYSLDGCDPNGYTGIAWAIGGVHDRAWQERPVFGKIRYMNEAGCRRKFDVDGYIEGVCGPLK